MLGRIARYRLNAVLSILLSAVYVGLSLYVPILAGRAIDNIIAPGSVDYAQIMLELTKIAIVAAIAALAQWLMNIINNSMTYNVVKDMRTEAFNRLMKLPLSYIDAHPYGETVSRIIADVDQFADGLLLGFSLAFYRNTYHNRHTHIHAQRECADNACRSDTHAAFAFCCALHCQTHAFHVCAPGRGQGGTDGVR